MMRTGVCLFVPVMWLLVSLPAQALEWYGDHARGWFWYEDPPVEEETVVPETRTGTAAAAVVPDPLEELASIRREIERARARAVLEPTEDNVRVWIEANRWQMGQAAAFTDVARRVIWSHPELDYSLRRPTMQLASRIYQDEARERRRLALEQLAETHGLFFFFRSDCPYCHRMAPILRMLEQRYGLEVLPISLDGGALPDYPTPRMDNGLAARLEVNSVPALYLAEPGRRNIMPVGFGLLSLTEIVDRIYILTQTLPGEEF